MAISGAASKVAKKFQNSKINQKLTKKLDDVTSSLKSKTKNITANIAKKTKEATQKAVNTVSNKAKNVANKTLKGSNSLKKGIKNYFSSKKKGAVRLDVLLPEKLFGEEIVENAEETITEQTLKKAQIQYGGTGITYKVFQRNDIDWDMLRSKGAKKGRGLTNAEAAERYGLAPILDADGNIATLHHSQQHSVGPLFEASTRYHNISNAKRAPLHPYKGQLNPFNPMSEEVRKAFQKVDSIEYWKARGRDAMKGVK
ncbi:MAG: HNH/ENDO VII family nuclease [Clostridium sp.]